MTGSFTQWVNSCRCELIDKAKEPVQICGLCGKQISSANTGSFTQWVLESQNCSCAKPMPLDGEIKHSKPAPVRATREPPVLPARRLTSEVGDLDTGNFPIERYKPVSKLGMGGGGLVYLCFDKHLRKNVAVKILHVTMPEQIVQFQSEAKVTARFKHPNIVEIIDFGLTEAGAPFMVLEYVDGKSLDVMIKERGPLPERVATELFIQIASALEKGHEYGVFHRDIKSSNIIIAQEKNGEAKARVIDFGIAMVAGSEDLNFRGQAIVGTPKYMCPDVVLGRQFDGRSDMYSFGCVMYETLTGALPFTGDSLTLLEKHTKEIPPGFSEVAPDLEISRQMEGIVRRCLEKHPDARYATMKQLKSVLQGDEDEVIGSSSVLKTLTAESIRNSEPVSPNSRAGRTGDASASVSSFFGTKSVEELHSKPSKSDTANHLILALVAVLIVGVIAFALFVLLRQEETEDGKVVSSIKSEDVKIIDADPTVSAPGTDGDTKSFDGFLTIPPLNAKAIELEKAFRFAEAEAAYTQAIALEKENSQWYRYRGLARMNQGKYDDALRDFNASIKLDHNDDNLRARSEYYMNCGSYTKADEDIHSAIARGPNKTDNFILMARMHSDSDTKTTEELERAQRALDKAISLEPERPEPYALRLIVDFRMHNQQDMDKTLAKVHSFSSDNALVAYCLANYAALQNNWGEAKTMANKTIQLNPAMWQAWELRGKAYRQLALEALEKQKIESEGETLSNAECNNRAVSDYYKAISLNPKNPKMLYTLSQYHAELDQTDSEIKYLTSAIELEPGNPEYYQARAEAYRKIVKSGEALEDCDTSIRLGNKNSRIHLLKGNALADLGKNEEAESAFSDCIKVKANNPLAYLCRGELRSKLHDYKNAIADFDVVLKLKPNDQRALEGRNAAFDKLKD
jgi:serine/threonine protein kinase/tetratricopeptide (TPR) repeat protein